MLALFFLLLLVLAFWLTPVSDDFEKPYAKAMYDRHGRLMSARIASDEQWRFKLEQSLPDKYIQALLVFEDKRFYHHPGVDPLALARALKLNVQGDQVVSGASTLTMQVIRLHRHNPPRTYGEKLLEMWLALRLDWAKSKEEILALYAGHAPFGGNVVGIEAASWRYFSQPLKDITWAQAATLAVLPNEPGLVHTGRNRQRLQHKRDALLRRLAGLGMMSELDLELALLEPLVQQVQGLPAMAPHLLDTLSLANPEASNYYTRLDTGLQSQLEAIAKEQGKRLNDQGIMNMAALVLDHQSSEVLGYLGNQRWLADSQFAYAMDLVHGKRSTGSLLKPFLFAHALDAGQILPGTSVKDIPSYFGSYQPQNFDRLFRGLVPAKTALARSLNVPAVNMLADYGLTAFYQDLHQWGMTTLFRPAEDYGLPLILGGAEGTLFELTSMFHNLMRQASGLAGQHPILMQAQNVTPMEVPVSAGAAWLTYEALLDVTRPGLDRHWQRFGQQQQIAWKTGTSYGYRDGWALGSNGRYTVGVWVGNASGEGRADLTGLKAAAPLLFGIFNQLPKGRSLVRPDQELKPYQVCRQDGFLATQGCETQTQWGPKDAQFASVSPYHQRIHLDPSGRWRVTSQCQRPSQMNHKTWFVLPPVYELFYKPFHADYRPLPPYRSDCQGPLQQQLGLVYPAQGARIFIPVELNGQAGAVILRATHKGDSAIHWHVDNQYLGKTQHFHQQSVNLAPGWHKLVLVDELGEELESWFYVIDPHEQINLN